jgi:hypothetical protein
MMPGNKRAKETRGIEKAARDRIRRAIRKVHTTRKQRGIYTARALYRASRGLDDLIAGLLHLKTRYTISMVFFQAAILNQENITGDYKYFLVL